MVKLLASNGESLAPASLFVHVSITKMHEMVIILIIVGNHRLAI